MSADAKILLVDDDPVTLRILRRALEATGAYDVRTASNGNEGLAAAEEFRPDLIISDRAMPLMDGLELCRRVKSQPELSSCLFVVLTSLTETEDRVQGLEQGADDYLVKPMPAEELRARVRTILRRRRAGDTAEPSGGAGEVVSLLTQVVDLAVPGAANRALQMAAAAQWMAEDLRMQSDQRANLDTAVRLHELGKLGLPPRLWRPRASQLTRDDRATLRTSTGISYALLRQVGSFEPAAVLIRHLYENWDGSGAPEHLQQGRIPLGSRVLRVLADFFEDLDRLTGASTRKLVLNTMQAEVGKAYDPAVFQALAQYVQSHLEETLAHQRRYVRVEDLQPGMTLASDLVTNSGAVLLREREVLGPEEVRRILRHHALDPFLFSICVQ
jgi:response regulator RpfG family c-di-GMP phosphodiesterase